MTLDKFVLMMYKDIETKIDEMKIRIKQFEKQYQNKKVPRFIKNKKKST